MTGEEAEDFVEALTSQLNPLLERVTYHIRDLPGRREFRLSAPESADYSFSVLAYRDGEAELSASLVGDRPEGEDFWYIPFERPAYESEEDLVADLLSKCEQLMANRTRIVQRRGLLTYSYAAECEEQGKWSHVGGVSMLRWGFREPKIEGRIREYESPPVLR